MHHCNQSPYVRTSRYCSRMSPALGHPPIIRPGILFDHKATASLHLCYYSAHKAARYYGGRKSKNSGHTCPPAHCLMLFNKPYFLYFGLADKSTTNPGFDYYFPLFSLLRRCYRWKLECSYGSHLHGMGRTDSVARVCPDVCRFRPLISLLAACAFMRGHLLTCPQ